MKLRQYPPHPVLSDFVKSFWASVREFQPSDDVLEILPDSYVELVFSFGAPCQIEDGSSIHKLPRCYLIGFTDRPVRLRAHGTVKSIAARFYLWGVVALLGLDIHALTQAFHQLDPSRKGLTDQIEQAVQTDHYEAAINHLHDFLIARGPYTS